MNFRHIISRSLSKKVDEKNVNRITFKFSYNSYTNKGCNNTVKINPNILGG